MPNPEAQVDITARSGKFKRTISNVRKTLQNLKKHMQAVSKTARMMLVGQVAAIGGLLKLYADQEAAEIRLAGVIKATGGAAGFTLKQFKAMASEMQKATGIGDEVVLNAQAILATFKNIKGDVFKDATYAMADLAAVMQTDLKGGAIQLGKALNDPITGMAALTRVGVGFTDQQKEMITTLQNSGDMVGAQTVIIKELQGQVHEVADALGQSFGGQMRLLIGTLGDLGEQIGGTLVPYMMALKDGIMGVVDVVKPWVESHKKLIGTIVILATGFTAFLAALGPVMFMVGKAVLVFKVFGAALLAITSPVGIAVAALVALGGVVAVALKESGALGEAWKWAGGVISTVGDWIKGVWEQIVDGIRWMTAYSGAMMSNWSDTLRAAILSFALTYVKAFNDLGYWLTETMPAYLGWFFRNWKGIWNDVVNFLAHVLVNAWNNIKNFFSNVWKWLKGDETDWNWTALSDGFERTLKEDLPNIAKRELTDTEKWLGTEISKSMESVIKEARRRYKKMIGGDKPATGPEGPDFEPAPVAPALAPTPTTDASAVATPEVTDGEKETVRSGAAFEGVTAAFNRMAEAAAGRTNEEEIAKSQLEKTQELVDESKKATAGWGAIKEMLGKVGDQISDAVKDQSGAAVFGG